MKTNPIDLGRELLNDVGPSGGLALRARRAICTHSELATEISLASIDEFVEVAAESGLSAAEICRNLRCLLRKLAAAKTAEPFYRVGRASQDINCPDRAPKSDFAGLVPVMSVSDHHTDGLRTA